MLTRVRAVLRGTVLACRGFALGYRHRKPNDPYFGSPWWSLAVEWANHGTDRKCAAAARRRPPRAAARRRAPPPVRARPTRPARCPPRARRRNDPEDWCYGNPWEMVRPPGYQPLPLPGTMEAALAAGLKAGRPVQAAPWTAVGREAAQAAAERAAARRARPGCVPTRSSARALACLLPASARARRPDTLVRRRCRRSKHQGRPRGVRLPV